MGTGTGRYVLGKQLRATGGIIVRVNDSQFHIDPGPGALVRALQYGVNLRENTCVMVSHSHIGHCNDINAVIDAMTHSGLDRQGVLISNQTVINGAEEYKPYLTDYYRNLLEKVITVNKDQRIGVNDTDIYALQANHTEPNTIGFKFITQDFVLSYSSDTSYSPKLADYYKDSDILILNVVNPGSLESEGNLNSEDAIKIIEKVAPRLTIVTHFGAKMLEADPLNEARYIQKETKQQVIAAKDGMSISPLSYAAKSRQKILALFGKSDKIDEPDNQETSQTAN